MTLPLLLALGCAYIPPALRDARLADLDGDGHDSTDLGGDDCDDTNPDVNPEAEDVAYDGIDQDCSGSPNNDKDGDGYDSSGYDGDDCDDEDPTIHPGAVDTAYDGVDQDCVDGPNNDGDGDGYASDAYPGGDDCQDNDPGVNPGAEDEACNGVDEDCSGADAVGHWPDADGDGHGDATDPGGCTADLLAADNTDCNDLDPTIYSGAPELCDQHYNDCDDQAWTEADEDTRVTLEADGVWTDLSDAFNAGTKTQGGVVLITLPTSGTISVCPGTYYVNVEDDPAGSVVDIVAPYGTENPATLDGDAADNFGSTVWVSWSDTVLTLKDLVITGGKDSTTGIPGGGLRVEAGEVNVEGGTITVNYGTLGGGIYNAGTVNVTDATIASNRGTNDGGGIYNDVGGQLTVTGTSVLANHTVNGSGAGIMLVGGETTISDCTIEGNIAYQGGAGIGLGGDAEATLTGTIVDSNQAERTAGGGAALAGDSRLYVLGSTSVDGMGFTNNLAQDNGGGVGLSDNAALYCTLCDFSGNDPSDIYTADGTNWTVPTSLDAGVTCDASGCSFP